MKSAGSLIPSLSYSIYSIRGTDNYLDQSGETIHRDEYAYTKGVTTILNIGYYYTFVYKNWYLNTFVIPGMGFDYNKHTNFTPTDKSKSNQTDFIVSMNGGAGFGYNANNLFLGGFISRTVRDQTNKKSETEFKSTRDAFSLYLGYRFKAPKKIAAPIDKLEEKLPFKEK